MAVKVQKHLKPQMQNKKVKLTAADHVFNICVNAFMVFILIAIIIPVWSTVTLSFRPADFLGTNLEGMFLPPWDWSTDAYTALLGNDGFLDAFLNSFKILIGGVACALILTVPMAYVLSVQSLPGRKIINMIVIIPYVFNVGMIPAYLLVKDIGLIGHLLGHIQGHQHLVHTGFRISHKESHIVPFHGTGAHHGMVIGDFGKREGVLRAGYRESSCIRYLLWQEGQSQQGGSDGLRA